MPQQQQQQRNKPPSLPLRVQQLKPSGERGYTSFNELGLTSPAAQREEFEEHDDDDDDVDQGTEHAKNQNQRRGMQSEGPRGREELEATRQRSGSLRLMEWFVRPEVSSSPP